MVKFKRLSPEERKRQICIAAKEVFLEKGFHNTTMEDVIAASKMSKGGVYNYYKNTTDMLYDLMLMGMNLRLSVSDDFIHKFQDLSLEDQFVELLFSKLFDYNDFKPLYTMFVLEMKNNKKFQDLNEEMTKTSVEMLVSFLKDVYGEMNLEYIFTNPGIIAFTSSLIVGVELMGNREDFLREKEMFREMLRAYIKYCEGKNEY